MPTIVTDRPYRAVAGDRPRKQWTRTEYAAFEATGLWVMQSDKLELVGGDLLRKMPKNRPHTYALTVMLAWAFHVFGHQFVNPETPIGVAPEDTPTNRPEPDIIVLSTPSREIVDRDPLPGELRLVVEIADTSVGFDLTTKADLYARAGIAECWVADIPARRLIVHRDAMNGLYQSVALYSEKEIVSPLAAPTASLPIADLFLA
jgi:Uma2 family endonuclease